MIACLEHGKGYNGAFEVFPASERVAKRLEKELGREPSNYYQTDWDFPGLARELGWRGPSSRSEWSEVSQAGDWLHDNVGRRFRVSAEFFGY